MRTQIIWTVICSVIASVIATLAFKQAGVDPVGWAGGIGAGVGVVMGMFIAARLDKGEDPDPG